MENGDKKENRLGGGGAFFLYKIPTPGKKKSFSEKCHFAQCHGAMLWTVPFFSYVLLCLIVVSVIVLNVMAHS